MAVISHRDSHRRRTTASSASLTARAMCRLILTVVAGLVVAVLAPYTIGWRPTVISSGSMVPAIAVGDVVVTAPAAPASIRTNDIIIFTEPATPGKNVAHRVITRNPDGSFTTGGDANQVADSTPLPASSVHGRVRFRVPFIGLPKHWLVNREWPPLVALCAVLATLVLGSGRPTAPTSPRHRSPAKRRT
jgi:signal peptidase